MKKTKKTSWTFDLGHEDYDLTKGGMLFRPVLLDGKEIFRIDKTKLMGKYQQDFTKDVIAVLKKITKHNFTKDDIQRALTLGVLSI